MIHPRKVCNFSGSCSDPRSGAALFVVIVFTIVLAEAASYALFSSSSGLKATAVALDRAQAFALGRATMPMTRAYISQDPQRRTRGGAFAADFPTGAVRIDYLSESARVDVNQSAPGLIGALLQACGLSKSEVDGVLARLAARRAAKPFTPYANAFETVQDWGLSDAQAEHVVPELTTGNHDGSVDPLLADARLLSALFDSAPERLADFESRRARGFPSEDSVLASFSQEARPWVRVADVTSIRALARVKTRHGLVERFETAFQIRPQGGDPSVYYWRAAAE